MDRDAILSDRRDWKAWSQAVCGGFEHWRKRATVAQANPERLGNRSWTEDYCSFG